MMKLTEITEMMTLLKHMLIGHVAPSFPTPDQVRGDVKDTVYQTTGIAFSCKDEIPNHVGNDIMTSSKAIPVLRPE